MQHADHDAVQQDDPQQATSTDMAVPTVVVQAPRGQAVWWLIAVSLMVIATCLVLRLDQPQPALAQPVSQAGARGVFAFTGQLSSGTYGVFMVDLDTTTLWCYEYVPSRRVLRLVGARTWKWDRYLDDFNNDEATAPAKIEEMVEMQRARRLQSLGSTP